MIKKYCDMCEREIGPKVANILNTGVTIRCESNKTYIISLANADTSSGYFSDDRALCAQCFLEAFKEEFKEELAND